MRHASRCTNTWLVLPLFAATSSIDWLAWHHTACVAINTMYQVLRGYIGDRSSGPVFEASSLFDVLGTGYQRPLELATLRLFNMIGILPKCE